MESNINKGNNFLIKEKEKDYDKTEKLIYKRKQSNVSSKNKYFFYFKSTNFSVFYVNDYDESCEEFSKIEKLEIINYSPMKIILFLLLNLLTAFLINLFIVWYPKLKMVFIYSKTSMNKGKFVGIYGIGNFLKY